METEKKKQRIPVEIQLCLWATVSLWASALIGIKIGLRGYTPGSLALLRYLVASLLLIILYFKLPQRHIPSFYILYIIFIGTLGIGIYNIAINKGEIVVPAGTAGFVIGLMPVFSMILAFILLKERIPIKCWSGVLVSLLGLLLIAYSQGGSAQYNIGLLYILLAAVLGSYYAVVQKTLFHRYHPLEIVILTIWGGTLIMLFYLPTMVRELTAAPWESTAAAILFGNFSSGCGLCIMEFCYF